MQQAIEKMEMWAQEWGFRFSVSKKKIDSQINLKLSGEKLQRVQCFKYLWVWFDKTLPWNIHIRNIEEKCKKVLSIIRCLRGRELGANRNALKSIYIALVTLYQLLIMDLSYMHQHLRPC